MIILVIEVISIRLPALVSDCLANVLGFPEVNYVVFGRTSLLWMILLGKPTLFNVSSNNYGYGFG